MSVSWWSSVVLLMALVAAVMAPSAAAHHRSEYYWTVGGANPLGPGGTHLGLRGTGYAVGGIQFQCPLKDCSFTVYNNAGGPTWFNYCYQHSPYHESLCWFGRDSARVRGYELITVYPWDEAGHGGIRVFAPQSLAYGFGLERSVHRLPYTDPAARTGLDAGDLAALPPPGCARHFLDVNQDGNVVAAGWLEASLPLVLPDLYFYDAFGVRIGAVLDPTYGEIPLPMSTASIMACNKGTLSTNHGITSADLMPDPGPLLLLQVSRPGASSNAH